jgi:hypothetical protein
MNVRNYANIAYKHLKILTLIGIVGLVWTFSGTDVFAQSDPIPDPETETTSQEPTTDKDKKYEFRRTPVFEYSTRGRRDPFDALVKEGDGEVKTDLLNVEEATLTGIVWGGDQMVAIFKDKDGKSHYMRKGSAVFRGRIVEISDNSVIVSLTQFGSTRRLEFKVTEHSLESSGG